MAASIEAAQMPFGLIPEIFYHIDMIILLCKFPRMLDAVMRESVDIQGVVR